MKDTTIKVVNKLVKADGTVVPSLGTALFLRSGDITLDNVTVTYENEAPSNIPTDEELEAKYATTTGFGLGSGRAILVVLNSYESINLNIKGGSYTGSAVGAPSVTIVEDGKDVDPNYDYNNSITISGSPTFSPTTTAFDRSYLNTKAMWVMDMDGWFYYRRAIEAGQQSELLLENVAKKSDDKNFLNEIYMGKNVTMDHCVNVRLQAISADLSDYALDKDAPGYSRDWQNENGAEITASADDYCITVNSKCTSNADKLIRAVSATV